MTNAEKYKTELKSLNRDTAMFERWGFDKRRKVFTSCGCIYCKDCAMHDIAENERKIYSKCNHARMTWMLSEYVEPIELTELEYNILKFLADNTKHMYIARDKKGSLYLYDTEPRKNNIDDWWIGKGVTSLTPFNKLFKFIKWKDKEPRAIKDILKRCEVKDCVIVR